MNLLREIERLNEVLMIKVEECNILANQVKTLEEESVNNKMKIFELGKKVE